jgi:hypothetical protein
MKMVFVLFILSLATVASAEQIEKTFTNSGLSRTDACSGARSQAELSPKYVGSCSSPNLSISNCECEEIPESRTSVRQHQCLVVAKLSCDEGSSSRSRSGSSSGYGGHEEVMSFSTLGGYSESQAEACGSAKNEASRWASVKDHKVTNLSSCDCSQIKHPIHNGFAWTCNVDATVRPR